MKFFFMFNTLTHSCHFHFTLVMQLHHGFCLMSNSEQDQERGTVCPRCPLLLPRKTLLAHCSLPIRSGTRYKQSSRLSSAPTTTPCTCLPRHLRLSLLSSLYASLQAVVPGKDKDRLYLLGQTVLPSAIGPLLSFFGKGNFDSKYLFRQAVFTHSHTLCLKYQIGKFMIQSPGETYL